MRNKLPMVGWYDPVHLIKTGLRVAISTVFGQFDDKREALASTNPIDPVTFDSSMNYWDRIKEGAFWFDFVADTGDGWHSTHAVARLLAKPSLTPDGAEGALRRGDILFMGGDQVYPTASRAEYRDRLEGPYQEAWEAENAGTKGKKGDVPDLYAVPGNHDWYDGLRAFFGLFCRRRVHIPGMISIPRDGKMIGGRQTQQTRSYFAVKLPGDWWFWGTDSQLEGYIDQPQIEYFQHVASTWMAKGSKVILAVGQPSWAYVDNERPAEAYASFSYLERLAGAARNADGKPMAHQLKLILSGDSHHYSRYTEDDRHYVTCGGGGAFLHPTHQLESKAFDWSFPPPGIAIRHGEHVYSRKLALQDSCFPEKSASRRLTLWNILFAFRNWRFPALFLAPLYLIFGWLLHQNAKGLGWDSLPKALAKNSFCDGLETYWHLMLASPGPIILAAAAIGGYRYFSDVKNSAGRLMVGVIHGSAQGLSIAAATVGVARLGQGLVEWCLPGWFVVASVAAAFASATVFGLYLLVNLGIFNRHWNEAFSSIAHRGYKSFLRLKIDAEGGLTVYAVGLVKVPRDAAQGKPKPALSPQLIETIMIA